MCPPHPEPPSHLPPCSIPLGYLRALALGALLHELILQQIIICFTYSNVHISVLFSLTIPLLTSPTKKIKQNLPLLTKWVRCSQLHTWKILDEDLKQFMPESNRIIFLLPRWRPVASRTCRTLSEMQSPWYIESDLLNHNLHLNYSPWYFLRIVNLGKC